MISELNLLFIPDKKLNMKYQREREISAESSESSSTNSSFSRQTSSTFSDSRRNHASQTTYLSSVNQSYDRLSINSEKNKSDSSFSNGDKSSTSNRNSFKCLTGLEKLGAFTKFSPNEKSLYSSIEKTAPYHEASGKKLPFAPNSVKSMTSYYEASQQMYENSDCQKHRKKVSIDFGRATSFLKYPLKNDRKREKSKLNKFSSSESHLESSSDNGNSRQSENLGSADEFFSESDKSSVRMETQSVLGANHWMSQESSICTFDSLSDLNLQPKWRCVKKLILLQFKKIQQLKSRLKLLFFFNFSVEENH